MADKAQPQRGRFARAVCSPLSLVLCTLSSVVASSVVVILFFILRRDRPPAAMQIVVDVSSPVGKTRDDFVCATLDWWPPQKCDYGRCSWGNSSILNLDLHAAPLREAVQALSPIMLRIGGTLQDDVTYDMGGKWGPSKCLPFTYNETSHVIHKGCLRADRWDAIFDFCGKTGCRIIFGLNALRGRNYSAASGWTGAWNPTNAHSLLQYTKAKGHAIVAWELGNEVGGPSGVRAQITAEQYARDVLALRKIVDQTWTEGPAKRPLVIAADSFWDESWHDAFLKATGPGGLDVLTYHKYSLGAGVDPAVEERMMDPAYLDREIRALKSVHEFVSKTAPWAETWVGESGGSYNSGRHLATNAFMSSFWYLDQIALAAVHGHQAYCRQSLVGGNYGLLNTTTLHPNPDFYAALMFRTLMGPNALRVSIACDTKKYLRAYAHCTRDSPEGGVTLLLLNMSPSKQYLARPVFSQQRSTGKSFLRLFGSRRERRQEYHFTAPANNLHSQVLLLNGNPLTYNSGLPKLLPQYVGVGEPIVCQPYSYTFVVVPRGHAFLGCCEGSTDRTGYIEAPLILKEESACPQ